MTPGVQRPYKAPEHVTAKKDKKYYYYIRYATSSVRANAEQERELINMTNYAPFDTRPNFEATESDISVALLTDHLNTTKKQAGKADWKTWCYGSAWRHAASCRTTGAAMYI